ncbi:MAG: DUF438 domain-containing protein [archaeon]
MSDNVTDRKKIVKSLIERLHDGAKPEDVKNEFKALLADVTPAEIAQIEGELIEAGMPVEEVQRLCDVHLAAFKESLEKEEVLAAPGHPVQILMEEHKLLLNFASQLVNTVKELSRADGFNSSSNRATQIREIAQHLRDSESHYLREENVLFPYLEKHGVTQPPAIMWSEHNKIREIEKGLYKLIDLQAGTASQEFTKQASEGSRALAETLSSHFYKENRILFPTALEVVAPDEWSDIRRQFDELGYCPFTPQPPEMTLKPEKTAIQPETNGMITFETGSLSGEEIECMLDSLPVDVTFVDKEDTVRYFSQSKDRIFPRTKAVVGRKVQLCHPQESLQKVIQILEDFKNDKRNVAEFWINLKGRLVLIRYFAVRSKSQEYLGCLEVTQDITDIQKITGEKRLLD